MEESTFYWLKGHGRIEPGWLRACLGLFKQHRVTIRKLILMKDQDPDCFSELEVQFLLPSEPETSPFLVLLTESLPQHVWLEQNLARM